jgi:hypothetical protein
MVTYTETNYRRCEACGDYVPTTYRLTDDPNGANACAACATEYAARVFCAETWPLPGDAWTADAEDVLDHVADWYDGEVSDGIGALRRDARIA